MKLTQVAAIVLVAMAACVQCSAQEQTAPAVTPSLMMKEKSSWTLAIRKNAAAYTALHAPNYLTVSDAGVQGRAQSEASALDANVSFDTCAFSDMHVHWMDPEVALVTYRVRFAGSDHGKRFAGDQYASSIWVRHGKQWLNTFYQATPAAAGQM